MKKICSICGEGSLAEISLLLADGGRAELTACNMCAGRRWRCEGRVVSRREVFSRLNPRRVLQEAPRLASA